jgi:hypothetical protein
MNRLNLTKLHCMRVWKCHNETNVQLIYANKNVNKLIYFVSSQYILLKF